MSEADIWTRGSKAYNQQAGQVLVELSHLYQSACLAWAGSQDGEAAMGHYQDGKLAVLFHLEEPEEALSLRQAICENRLRAAILSAELTVINEALEYKTATSETRKRKAKVEKLLAELGEQAPGNPGV